MLTSLLSEQGCSVCAVLVSSVVPLTKQTMSPSWFRLRADFQIEKPSVPSNCTVQLTVPPKNRYSCLSLESNSEAVQYTKCDGMWKKINGQATQFSIPHLREPASSLWSLGESHLWLKGLLLWHFREEKLEDSSTCWVAENATGNDNEFDPCP